MDTLEEKKETDKNEEQEQDAQPRISNATFAGLEMESNKGVPRRYTAMNIFMSIAVIIVIAILSIILAIEIDSNYFDNSSSSSDTDSDTSTDALYTSGDSDLTPTAPPSDTPTKTPSSEPVNCSDSTCTEYSDIQLEIGFDSAAKLKLYSLPNKILPGVQFFTYSYNLLQGKPPMDLLFSGDYNQIFSLTFDNDKVSAGSEAYLVPDQINLPAISAVCQSQSKTTAISSSSSTASMHNDARENTGSDSFSASVSASGWGFSGSASYAMSLSHSHSASSDEALSQATSGMTESMYKISKAKLYGAKIRWNEETFFSNIDDSSFTAEFAQSLQNLSDSSMTNVELLDFIQTWGTHVLERAVLGSQCRESTHFSSGTSAQSLSRSASEASSASSDYSGSASASGSGWGFSASVSASYSQASGSSYTSSSSNTNDVSYSADYSSETTYCVGEVYITSMCGEMLGRQNEPSLVEYQLKPIWELTPLRRMSANSDFETFMGEITDAGLSLCGGIAIPAANKDFWISEYSEWEGSNFTKFWDDSRCFDQFMLGLTLLKTGSNVTSDFSTEECAWTRREYTLIEFGSFCEETGKLDISFALQMIPFNTSFGIELAQQNEHSFSSYFRLGAGKAVEFGAASYLLLCDEIQKNIYTTTLSVAARSTTVDFYYFVEELDADFACKDDYTVQFAYKSITYDYLGSNSSDIYSYMQFIATNSIHNNTHFGITAYQYAHGLGFNGIEVTCIIFCESSRILTSDVKSFSLTDFTALNSASGNSKINKEMISYENTYGCQNVKVWTGISVLLTTCNIGIWVENEHATSFVLVAAIWDSTQGCVVLGGDQVVVVSYVVFCVGV